MKYFDLNGKGVLLGPNGPVITVSGGSPVSEAELLEYLACALRRIEALTEAVAATRHFLATATDLAQSGNTEKKD
jgi:hypothetical protein